MCMPMVGSDTFVAWHIFAMLHYALSRCEQYCKAHVQLRYGMNFVYTQHVLCMLSSLALIALCYFVIHCSVEYNCGIVWMKCYV